MLIPNRAHICHKYHKLYLGRKKLSRGEISAVYTEFQQYMEFYWSLCRFSSKSMWRKICARKICVEKKWRIWGRNFQIHYTYTQYLLAIPEWCWSQILTQILNLCWFQIFAQILNSDSMLIPRHGLNSSHFPKCERSQTDANSNLPDKSRLTNTNRT